MSLTDLRKQYGKLVADALRLQTEYEGKAMPPNVGQEFETATKEAEKLQNEIKEVETRDATVKRLGEFMREIPPDTKPLPAPAGGPDYKGGIEGYISPGQAFSESDAFLNYLAAGKPMGGSSAVTFKTLHGPDRFIGLDHKAMTDREARIEQKAVPTIGGTIGTAVIEPMRISEVVRTTEYDRLVMRDVVNVSPTSSNAVQYVTITSALPTAALPVAESAVKPESTVALGVATAPVRTLAVWMPVTEQQLEDIPQVRNIVDVELRFDIARLEEYQMVWGVGTGENLLGIMKTSGVVAGRAVGGDTLIDRIRRAMTDVRTAELEPNAIAIHPMDWETIALVKGTDNHYLAQVFPDAEGNMRIWGLRVVETVAMTEYRSANTTDQRVILVGDFQRGATLWDRHQTSVAVGYINDQFIKNQRTIRAEERVAFGVKRPNAFKFVETVAAVA